MDVVEVLAQAPRTSVEGVAQAVQLCRDEPGQVELVVQCLDWPHAGVRMRAADTLQKLGEIDPGAVQPWAQLIVQGYCQADQPDVRWNLLQLMPIVDLDEACVHTLVPIIRHDFHHSTSRIVMACALHALVELARQHPQVQPVATAALQQALRSPIPSLAARARKLCR